MHHFVVSHFRSGSDVSFGYWSRDTLSVEFQWPFHSLSSELSCGTRDELKIPFVISASCPIFFYVRAILSFVRFLVRACRSWLASLGTRRCVAMIGRSQPRPTLRGAWMTWPVTTVRKGQIICVSRQSLYDTAGNIALTRLLPAHPSGQARLVSRASHFCRTSRCV